MNTEHQHHANSRQHGTRSKQIRGKRQQHPHQNGRTGHHGGRAKVAETNVRQTLIGVRAVR
ncbi:hypothetical protein, partial [Pseudomonas sp. GP01-A8]|uniref:hypothetical protein n=1 Tax=Pseudomonas sp. GP01-A8 TaxID=2070565 RepID=UPI00156EA41A